MKKKRPSLLDIEMFAKERADSRLDKLKKIEEQTFEAVEASKQPYEETPRQQTEAGSEEYVDELVEFVTTYRTEILNIKNDLFKVKEQLRIYSSMVNSQQKKISKLMEAYQQESQQQEGPVSRTVQDDNYYRLVLRNVIWLKEEKGFTTNDVLRLFRAEGFEAPAPHKSWNEDVVERLYAEARRVII